MFTAVMPHFHAEETKKLIGALNNLESPEKVMIIIMLKEANRPVAYSEIKKIFGEDFNDNKLWRHLKSLERAELIIHDKGVIVKINPETGKARTSFYRLTDYAYFLLERGLEKIFRILVEWRKTSKKTQEHLSPIFLGGMACTNKSARKVKSRHSASP